MTHTKVLLYALLMCIITGCTVYWLAGRDNKKIAVVDAVKLFDQFNLKKELEAQAKVKLESMSKQMDSTANQLRMAQATQNQADIQKSNAAYTYARQSLQDAYTQSNKDINEQVWKRLNAIIEQFGKDRHLHVILGANGMGSILYNDDYYDLTTDAVNYANKKYEEGN